MKVAYIIPSAVRGGHLHRSLDSILGQTLPPGEVLLVANGWDGRLAAGAWRTLTLARNSGYTAACNLGILSTEAPWIALVNDDAVLPPEWAESLLPILEADASSAAVTGATVTPSGRPIAAGSRWNSRFEAVETDNPDEVSFLNFTAVLFRREILMRAGLFPDRYFAYYDDVDASLRLRAVGAPFSVAPHVKVVHSPSTTAPLLGRRRWFYLLRNRYWTLCRHFGLSFVLRRFHTLFRSDIRLAAKLAVRPDLLVRAYASIPLYPRWNRG